MLLVIAANRLAFIEMSQFHFVLIGWPTFLLFLPLCLANFSYLTSNYSSLPLPQTTLSGLMRESHVLVSESRILAMLQLKL